MTRFHDRSHPTGGWRATGRAIALSCAALSLCFALSSLAQAQTVLQEVVVTAQKRKQSEQNVPITMSVLTGDQLRALDVTNIAEVTTTTPNVEMNYGFGQNSFNIRGLGVNFFAPNLGSPVTVSIDGVPMSEDFMTSLMLFDIDRVEVLKGPQGTLYGLNTTGGAVNFYTNQPTPRSTAGLTVGYGDYQAFHSEGFLSGPLGAGFTGRLSAYVEDQREGFYHNITRNADEGRPDKWALRGKLDWSRADAKVAASFHYGRDKSQLAPYQGVGIYTPQSVAAGHPVLCPQYLNGTVTGATANCVRGTDGGYPGTANPFISTGNIPHQANNTSFGGSTLAEISLPGFTLTSLSGFESYERIQQESSDASPAGVINVFWYQKVKQGTEELRLTSDRDGPWQYILGTFYEHDDLLNGDYLAVAQGAAPGYYSPFDQHVNSAAAFFHNSLRVTRSLTLQAGVRYSWERTQLDGGTYAAVGLDSLGNHTVPTTIIAPLALSSAMADGGRRTDEDTTYKAGISWTPALRSRTVNHLLVYADVATGFRAGGFNADLAAIQDSMTTLAPEKITSYEAGFKATLAQRAMLVNGAVFHYDLQNGFMNVDSASAPIPVTINAAKVAADGAELSLQWLPVDGLDLRAGGGWLDSKIDSNITNDGVSLYGQSPVNSPKFTADGAIEYSTPLTGAYSLQAVTDASWRGRQYLYIPNDPANAEKAYAIWNASLTLFGPGNWSVSFWGKNLSNTIYRTYVNDLRGFGWLLNIYGPPRTYGLNVTVKY